MCAIESPTFVLISGCCNKFLQFFQWLFAAGIFLLFLPVELCYEISFTLELSLELIVVHGDFKMILAQIDNIVIKPVLHVGPESALARLWIIETLGLCLDDSQHLEQGPARA